MLKLRMNIPFLGKLETYHINPFYLLRREPEVEMVKVCMGVFLEDRSILLCTYFNFCLMLTVLIIKVLPSSYAKLSDIVNSQVGGGGVFDNGFSLIYF